MQIRYRRKLEQATSVIEALVAIGILVTVGALLLTCFSYGFFVVEMARENQRATQIILEKAETIRLYNWDQVNKNGFIPTTFTEVYDPQAQAGSRGVTYNGTITITNFQAAVSYRDKIRQFTVSLQWTSSHSIVRARSLTTWVAKDGLQNYVY